MQLKRIYEQFSVLQKQLNYFFYSEGEEHLICMHNAGTDVLVAVTDLMGGTSN